MMLEMMMGRWENGHGGKEDDNGLVNKEKHARDDGDSQCR